MTVTIRAYEQAHLACMTKLWNDVVLRGEAFPQLEPLPPQQAAEFFAQQSHTAVALEGDTVAGLYILHPNNVGRCAHIANASFAVAPAYLGRGIGERLVRDCMHTGKTLGFRLLQFNAVVAGNRAAIGLYTKLGFHSLGRVPGGFLKNDGSYEDILLFYIKL